MKNIEALQFKIFKYTRMANKQLDNIIEELHQEIKDRDLSPIQRNLMKIDLKKLVFVRHELKELCIMQDFYQKYLHND